MQQIEEERMFSFAFACCAAHNLIIILHFITRHTRTPGTHLERGVWIAEKVNLEKNEKRTEYGAFSTRF